MEFSIAFIAVAVLFPVSNSAVPVLYAGAGATTASAISPFITGPEVPCPPLTRASRVYFKNPQFMRICGQHHQAGGAPPPCFSNRVRTADWLF